VYCHVYLRHPERCLFQAEREPALSEVEGDLTSIVTALGIKLR
jgi:hypothetical protein